MDEKARRIVADEQLRPEEYNAVIGFEGWETEDGTDQTGWDLIVDDGYHGVHVTVRYHNDGTVSTQVMKGQ